MKYGWSELAVMARQFMSEYYSGDRHGMCRGVIQELQLTLGLTPGEIIKRINKLSMGRGRG